MTQKFLEIALGGCCSFCSRVWRPQPQDPFALIAKRQEVEDLLPRIRRGSARWLELHEERVIDSAPEGTFRICHAESTARERGPLRAF
jgi:hypothetical protein